MQVVWASSAQRKDVNNLRMATILLGCIGGTTGYMFHCSVLSHFIFSAHRIFNCKHMARKNISYELERILIFLLQGKPIEEE
jgi:hypothetical protein